MSDMSRFERFQRSEPAEPQNVETVVDQKGNVHVRADLPAKGGLSAMKEGARIGLEAEIAERGPIKAGPKIDKRLMGIPGNASIAEAMQSGYLDRDELLGSEQDKVLARLRGKTEQVEREPTPAPKSRRMPLREQAAPQESDESAVYRDQTEVRIGDVILDPNNNMGQIREAMAGMWKLSTPATGTIMVESQYFKRCKLLKRTK